MDIYQQSLQFHEKYHGKLTVELKVPLENREDLSLAYTPGVAEPCRAIAKNVDDAYRYTMKGNAVALVSDGSAVLGLGNIGAAAAIPVMEGKCALFKRFGNIDAFPLCLDTQDTEEIIRIVKSIAPVFGGINLEDIAAPRCFEIEERLQAELNIPVFHDDQHGTAIVVLAALINAMKVTGKKLGETKIVISGAGAAGVAISKLLLLYDDFINIILCDRQGAIYLGRPDLKDQKVKSELAESTNLKGEKGSLEEVLRGADVFIGVSAPGLVTTAMVKTMAPKAIVFAMANPVPEIMPDEAFAGGAAIVGTGRSDFPNQINNVLAFPGIFRAALDMRAPSINVQMKLVAAEALASCVKNPTAERIVPGIFDEGVVEAITHAVQSCDVSL